MKKIAFLAIVCSILVLNTNKTAAQKTPKLFSGTITYSLTYEGDVDPATLAALPKEQAVTISGNKNKMVTDQGGANITQIVDGDKKVKITLIDIASLGKKIMLKQTAEEIDKANAKAPASTIKYLDETKEISGYKCKKGQVITKDEDGKEVTTDFYYSEELGSGDINFDDPQFKDVKGVLMECKQQEGKVLIKMVVTKVKKQKISDNDFLVPSGYEEMTQEQIQNMFGGGGQ